MRKKVLFLNLTTFSRTGGIEKFNRSFLKAMYETEAEGRLYSNAHSLYDNSPDEKYYPDEKYSGYNQNREKFIVQSLLKARRFDCIVLGHINLAIVGWLIKFFLPKKELILVVHGIEVWEGVSPIKKGIIEKVNRILSVSQFTWDKLTEYHNVKTRAVTIFPNTVDPFFPIATEFRSVATRRKYDIADEDFVLFTLTRLSSREKYKGYDIVIRCLPEVVKKYRKIRYVIAGKYDEEEKARIDELVRQLELEGLVSLLGFIDENEISDHYRMSDVFIMPSQKEGFGIVFIEAMTSGVPVIAGNMDGSVEALREGELGLLVNPESEAEITEAILKTINKGKKQHSYSYELQQKALSYFGYPKFKERLQNVLCKSNLN